MQTLLRYLQQNNTDKDLTELMETIALSCKEISFRLQQGAMADVLGAAGIQNVQGEEQKKLDVVANELMKELLLDSSHTRAIGSEEEEDIVDSDSGGRFLVAFDPLDGSSNIDINSMLGTIFSVMEAPHKAHIEERDFLQPGDRQIAAGYVVYGPAVMMALSTGKGVQMFTLDQRIGEFILTQDRVQIPEDTREFAINMSNRRFWQPPMQRYIDDLLAGKDGPRGKNYNMRWVAAMVADVHRILCRGGIFMYPWDSRDPSKPGKLRLMYEANPMGWLVEQAGGAAWTDQQRILDIEPMGIHQRVPVILGSINEVRCCVDYHQS